MGKKGQKGQKDVPEMYDEVKKRVNLALTPTGIEGLDAIRLQFWSKQVGACRENWQTTDLPRCKFLHWGGDGRHKKALIELIVIYRDQLNGQGLFTGSGIVEGDRKLQLQKQIEQWEQIRTKISIEKGSWSITYDKEQHNLA